MKTKKNHNAWRNRQIAAGNCGYCGRPRNNHSKRLCDACLARAVISQEARTKRWRAKKIACGRCEVCGKPRSPGSRRFCARHRKINSDRVLAINHERVAQGLCVECKQPVALVNGHRPWRCHPCAEKMRLRAEKRHARRRAAGRCVACNTPVPQDGVRRATCRRCRDRQRAWKAKRLAAAV